MNNAVIAGKHSSVFHSIPIIAPGEAGERSVEVETPRNRSNLQPDVARPEGAFLRALFQRVLREKTDEIDEIGIWILSRSAIDHKEGRYVRNKEKTRAVSILTAPLRELVLAQKEEAIGNEREELSDRLDTITAEHRDLSIKHTRYDADVKAIRLKMEELRVQEESEKGAISDTLAKSLEHAEDAIRILVSRAEQLEHQMFDINKEQKMIADRFDALTSIDEQVAAQRKENKDLIRPEYADLLGDESFKTVLSEAFHGLELAQNALTKDFRALELAFKGENFKPDSSTYSVMLQEQGGIEEKLACEWAALVEIGYWLSAVKSMLQLLELQSRLKES